LLMGLLDRCKIRSSREDTCKRRKHTQIQNLEGYPELYKNWKHQLHQNNAWDDDERWLKSLSHVASKDTE
jgi:hypothetical protein